MASSQVREDTPIGDAATNTTFTATADRGGDSGIFIINESGNVSGSITIDKFTITARFQ